MKGFSDKNIWRMKQFYETYKDFPKLSPLVREISWTHNLAMNLYRLLKETNSWRVLNPPRVI
jgi:hypothetical protein